jgi:hypothetical protein
VTIRNKKFYSRISRQRKKFVGGQYFKDPEAARLAQAKSVESRRVNKEKKMRDMPEQVGD